MKHILIAALALIVPAPVTAQSSDAFTHVAGNVYYFKNGSYNSLVVATDEGTVVVDPLNNSAAQRLQANLSALLTN